MNLEVYRPVLIRTTCEVELVNQGVRCGGCGFTGRAYKRMGMNAVGGGVGACI